jgi:hypothetical protein
MAGLEAAMPPVFAAVVRTIGIVARLLAVCGGAGFGLLTRSTLPPSWQGQDDHGGKCQNHMLHVNSLDFFLFSTLQEKPCSPVKVSRSATGQRRFSFPASTRILHD